MRGARAREWGVVAAAALAAACGGGEPAAPEAGERLSTVEGRVTRTSGGTVVVRPPGGDAVELRVPDGVHVTFGDVHLPRTALRLGDAVRASYAQRGDEAVAAAVDVEREGGAYMLRASEVHRGLAPDLGGSAPAHRAQDRAAGSDRGPASRAGGGARSGGAAGGGPHGPEGTDVAKDDEGDPAGRTDPR